MQLGRVEWNVSSQLPKENEQDSRNIFYRLLRRHLHEAVALYLQSRYTTLNNHVDVFVKGCRTKTGITKKCAGQKPVSQKHAKN